METLDTNVVVRLLVQDDEDQCRRAEALLRRVVAAGGAWIPTVVLIEVSWVLRTAYEFDRATIVVALRGLHSTEGVSWEDASGALRALEDYERGAADYSDYVIVEAARRSDALPVHTFDERLAREDGARLVP